MQDTIELLQHSLICQLYTNRRSDGINPSTEKLLDIALICLARKNKDTTAFGFPHNDVDINLTQYAALCGLTEPSKKTNRQKLKGIIKRDIDVLTRTMLRVDNKHAFPVFEAAEFSSTGIHIVFCKDLVQFLVERGSLFQLPTALLRISNCNPNAYAIGREMFLRGNRRAITIGNLIKICPSIHAPEDLRLTNSTIRRWFLQPLSTALELLCRERILEWWLVDVEQPRRLNGPGFLNEKVRYRLHIPQNPLSASESVRITDFERSNKEMIIKDEWGAIDLSFMHRMLEGEFTFESSRIRS